MEAGVGREPGVTVERCVGKGAAKLDGLAYDRNTALAFCFPVEGVAGTSVLESEDLVRLGCGGAGSDESEDDFLVLFLLPPAFLDASVLALAPGGPQWANRDARSAGARSSTRKRHCLPVARQFWHTGASGDSRQRTFLARHASHALTGRVRFLGSAVTGEAEDCARAERADDASCADASCDELEGPAAAATEARVSAAAMMADEVIRAWVSVVKVCDVDGKPITVACCSRGERGIHTMSRVGPCCRTQPL